MASIGFAILCLATGFLGAGFSRSGVRTWYMTIQRPSWTPPNWVFGPVWTVLYILMGISMGLVYDATTGIEREAFLAFFLAHLVVNFLWSYIFFALHKPALAALDIGVLWAMIAGMIMLFSTVSTTAALLLIPYLLWVTYASSLNIGILFFNNK